MWSEHVKFAYEPISCTFHAYKSDESEPDSRQVMITLLYRWVVETLLLGDVCFS